MPISNSYQAYTTDTPGDGTFKSTNAERAALENQRVGLAIIAQAAHLAPPA